MTELPEHQLLTRSDQPWEQELDRKRINRALRWATRQMGEFHVATELGMDPHGEEGLAWRRRISRGMENRLTRADLIVLALDAASPAAHELADRMLARQQYELDLLDANSSRSTVDSEHPVPLN